MGAVRAADIAVVRGHLPEVSYACVNACLKRLCESLLLGAITLLSSCMSENCICSLMNRLHPLAAMQPLWQQMPRFWLPRSAGFVHDMHAGRQSDG